MYEASRRPIVYRSSPGRPQERPLVFVIFVEGPTILMASSALFLDGARRAGISRLGALGDAAAISVGCRLMSTFLVIFTLSLLFGDGDADVAAGILY